MSNPPSIREKADIQDELHSTHDASISQQTKTWDITDSFKHAPAKPDGDPWNSLLKPRLEEDSERCDSWKEEVQNLLIFAGLFSAVVTAFVVESYRTMLRPDPHDTIIALLSHIAVRLDNSSSPISPIPTVDFSPTDRSFRINAFWFVSLVLSLTTVLIGTISLQWLREHQSYPNLSPREIFALFRMRSEGLERWKVPLIFAALPLLLQSALVLFFIGMVDFSLLLGNEVAIPVITAIGITLIFLVMTITFPTLQGFRLYFPFHTRDPKRLPAQCPYKSPQSQAFRATCSLLFIIINSIFDRVKMPEVGRGRAKHITENISSTWQMQTWVDFDIGWLSIRDAIIQGIHDKKPGLSGHRYSWRDSFPLFDAAQGLREAVTGRLVRHKGSDSLRLAAYHCFEELSLSITKPSFREDNIKNTIHRQVIYFQKIWMFNSVLEGPDANPTMSEFFDLAGNTNPQISVVLHHENVYMFLFGLLQVQGERMWPTHRVEVGLRLKQFWSKEKRKLLPSAVDSQPPIFLQDDLLYFTYGLSSAEKKGAISDEFYSQYAYMLSGFFNYVGIVSRPNLSEPTFHTHKHVSWFLDSAANHTGYFAVIFDMDRLNPIFDHINQKFEAYISSTVLSDRPRLLFYTASLYIQPLIRTLRRRRARISPSLQSLLRTMHEYKLKTSTSHDQIDAALEERFGDKDAASALGAVRFSKEWWKFLNFRPLSAEIGASQKNSPNFSFVTPRILAASLDGDFSNIHGPSLSAHSAPASINIMDYTFPSGQPSHGGDDNV